MEPVVLLPLFVAGFGCVFYLRDRIIERRRTQYPVKPYLAEKPVAQRGPEPDLELDQIRKKPFPGASAPNGVRSLNVTRRSAAMGDPKIDNSSTRDFDPDRISAELRSLLELLPREERKRDS